MTVRHLNCGTMRPHAIGTVIARVLLVESPRGLLLVDTGFGLADIADPARLGPARHLLRPVLNPAETALRQLERLGYRGEDVRDIVLTHLDLDHIGGLADFPAARVHVLATEHAAATRPPSRRDAMRYRSQQWAHGPRWQTYSPAGERFHGLAAARPLDGLGDGVALIPLTGHTRGHAGVAVDTGDGWLVHAGDAFFCDVTLGRACAGGPGHRRGLRGFEQLAALQRNRLADNHLRLRELAATGHVHIVSAHDVHSSPQPDPVTA